MLKRDAFHPALAKYAKVGRLFAPEMHLDDEDALKMLLGMLEMWQQHFNMPKLSEYGVQEADLDKMIRHISGGSMATNPIVLEYDEMKAMLKARL